MGARRVLGIILSHYLASPFETIAFFMERFLLSNRIEI